VRSRHICSAQHLTISFYINIDIVMHNRSIFNLYDWAYNIHDDDNDDDTFI